MEEKRNYKVLLLDDERLVLMTVGAYLRNTEFVLTAVSTAEEALQALRHTNYDVIVSDIVMSPVDGFAFRAQVRSFAPELPFIFLTSAENSSDNALFSRVMDDLFSYFIPKNGNAILLLQKLRQVVKVFSNARFMRQQEHIIQRNKTIGSMVQQSLLPPWAYRSNGGEFAYLYRPLERLSGDLLEVYEYGRSANLFIFGDVSGHGTHAGLVMAAMQSYLRQSVNDGNVKKPHEIARLINRFLCTNFSGLIYMCTQIVFCDFAHNLMLVLNCGMPDIVRLSPGEQTARRISTDGRGTVPLGLYANLAFSPHDCTEIRFADDDLFFFLSDGIIDQSRFANGDGAISTHELKEIIAQAAWQEDNAVWSMPYRIFSAVCQRGYHCQQDDCSLLVLRKSPPLVSGRCIQIIPADCGEIDQHIQELEAFLKGRGADEELCVHTGLLLSEFLTNIYRHGLRNQTIRNDCTVIQLDCMPDGGVEICAWERGRQWLERLDSAASRRADQILEELNTSLSTHGRGLPIMQKIAGNIKVSSWTGANKTVFRIPHGRSSEAAQPHTPYPIPHTKNYEE